MQKGERTTANTSIFPSESQYNEIIGEVNDSVLGFMLSLRASVMQMLTLAWGPVRF